MTLFDTAKAWFHRQGLFGMPDEKSAYTQKILEHGQQGLLQHVQTIHQRALFFEVKDFNQSTAYFQHAINLCDAVTGPVLKEAANLKIHVTMDYAKALYREGKRSHDVALQQQAIGLYQSLGEHPAAKHELQRLLKEDAMAGVLAEDLAREGYSSFAELEDDLDKVIRIRM